MMMNCTSRPLGREGQGRPVPTLASSLRRGFTLTELLAAIAIIVVIATITAVSVRGLAREARQSSATNAVVAALDTGRAIAIRDNTLIAVVFRPRLVGDNKQQIEIVTARWTGETPILIDAIGRPLGIDRFEPVSGITARRLPTGVSIAAPRIDSYGFEGEVGDFADRVWSYASYLPTVARANGVQMGQGDPPGFMFAVLYGPNGSVVLRNAASNALRMFVDFNRDGLQQVSGCTQCGEVVDYTDPPAQNIIDFPVFHHYMREQMAPDDEPYISPVPFLAVYNEDNFRDMYDPLGWIDVEGGGWAVKHQDLTEFVNDTADRIHFNRYTGVVMR